MALSEVVPQATDTAGWASPGKLREDGRLLVAFKWLREGAVDPDDGFDWAEDAWLGEETSFGMVYAVGPDGLADGVNDELWIVELADPIGIALSAEQRSHGGPHVFEVPERRVLARRARILRRIEGWDQDLALEFASECARRVAVRVCQSLSDSSAVLEEPGDLRGGLQTELGPLLRRAGLEPEPRELSALRCAEELIGIWRDARIAHSLRIDHPAQIYGTAAAASRAVSVMPHCSGAGSKTDRAAGDRAYAEERRWQSHWLAGRLELADTLEEETFAGALVAGEEDPAELGAT